MDLFGQFQTVESLFFLHLQHGVKDKPFQTIVFAESLNVIRIGIILSPGLAWRILDHDNTYNVVLERVAVN
jgi:hypothetical protein